MVETLVVADLLVEVLKVLVVVAIVVVGLVVVGTFDILQTPNAQAPLLLSQNPVQHWE